MTEGLGVENLCYGCGGKCCSNVRIALDQFGDFGALNPMWIIPQKALI